MGFNVICLGFESWGPLFSIEDLFEALDSWF